MKESIQSFFHETGIHFTLVINLLTVLKILIFLHTSIVSIKFRIIFMHQSETGFYNLYEAGHNYKEKGIRSKTRG